MGQLIVIYWVCVIICVLYMSVKLYFDIKKNVKDEVTYFNICVIALISLIPVVNLGAAYMFVANGLTDNAEQIAEFGKQVYLKFKDITNKPIWKKKD